MPHDKNGAVLKEGNKVTIEAVIKSLTTGTEACNVTLVTTEPFYPSAEGSTLVLNTKQVTKLTD